MEGQVDNALWDTVLCSLLYIAHFNECHLNAIKSSGCPLQTENISSLQRINTTAETVSISMLFQT